MNFKDKLKASTDRNKSLLCIGLDPEIEKLPASVSSPDKFFEFCKAIIDSTADLVCAYKPNSAFYEAEGADGVRQLKAICDYISTKYPEIPIIIDAKRADIGNTNVAYAKYVFDYLKADSLTVNPYLGSETLQPFLDRGDKGIIVLCRTSNPGADEFQDLMIGDKKLYQIVAEKVKNKWNRNKNCLMVVGATYPEELAEIRSIVGDEIDLLIPGIGAQGGDIDNTVKAGMNSQKAGMIISSSRSVIFASGGHDFADAARQVATKTRDMINSARF
jgi:orotidine-5'-phosphate decarboxylase